MLVSARGPQGLLDNQCLLDTKETDVSDSGNGDFEFERRFFVRDAPAHLVDDAPTLIVQSYYLSDDGYALRVRAQAPTVRDSLDLAADELTLLRQHADEVDFAAVTAKGPMVEGTRYEAERQIEPDVAVQMVLRGGQRVAKLRHAVWLGEDGWVIDEFLAANAPLVIAEVERGGPVTDLAIPSFCFTEVTADLRMSNEALASRPFSAWAGQYDAELAALGPAFLDGLGVNRSFTV
jgi:CYTH domain-containing protein